MAFVLLGGVVGCDKLTTSWAGPPGTVVPLSSGQPAPGATGKPIQATALAAIDAGAELSDFAQAKEYRKNGQTWMARMLVEKKALSDAGTKEDVQFLAEICADQGDTKCVDACNKKLGTKMSAKTKGSAAVDPGLPSAIPDDDLAKAREALHRGDKKRARAILEPRMLENKASHDEIQLLHELCRLEDDKMCMALCKTRL